MAKDISEIVASAGNSCKQILPLDNTVIKQIKCQ